MDRHADALRGYIDAARYQRELMEPWCKDKHFVESGGTLLYALDTNIFKLYTAPEAMSTKTERRKEGYAQVFPGDDEDLSIALGYSLAKCIFYHLTDLPLLVIPPIESEIRRVYEAVTFDAEKEQKGAREDLELIKSDIKSISGETDNERLLTKLLKNVPRLAKFIAGYNSPSSELRNFGRLMTETRIASPEYTIRRNWFTDERVRCALAPVEGVHNWMHIYRLKEGWFDRCIKVKPVTHSGSKVNDYAHAMSCMERSKSHINEKSKSYLRNLLNDVQVMARLEWINSKLGDEYRLVYITGDHGLNEAADTYYLGRNGESFAKRYLRHPRAYLAEPQVLSVGKVLENTQYEENSGENTEFLKWLDTFLGKQDGDKMDEESIKLILEAHPKILDNLKDNWSQYTRNILLSNIPEMNSLHDVKNNVKALIEKVETLLEEKVHNTWNSCFGIASETGLGLLVKMNSRSRNYPILEFNSLLKTQEFVKKILSSCSSKSDVTYKEVIAELTEEDPSGYAYNLAYAFVFAAWGNWHVSSILARRAVEIAIKSEQKHISGREATYMLGIALRHSAKHVRNFATAELLLRETEQHLKQDRSNRPKIKVCSSRFKVELTAIHSTRRFFNFFLGEEIPENTPTFAYIQSELQELLDRLSLPQQDNPWVIRSVERNILTNIFMIALLRQYKLHEHTELALLIRLLEQFEANLESKDKPCIEISFRVRSIWLAARLYVLRDHKDRRKMKRELQYYLTDLNIEENCVFPYDKKRFEFLRKIF